MNASHRILASLPTALLGAALVVLAVLPCRESAGSPGQSVENQPAPSPQEVQELVKKLGSSKYAERQAAQKALLELGHDVVPVLDQFKDVPDVETRIRLEKIRYQLVGWAEEILRYLETQASRYDDKSPEVPGHIKTVVAAQQPKSGALLLALVLNSRHPQHWPAVNLLVQTWDSHSIKVVETYLQSQLRLRCTLRPRYPAKIAAGIEMGYYLHFGSGGWPRGLRWQTRTTH